MTHARKRSPMLWSTVGRCLYKLSVFVLLFSQISPYSFGIARAQEFFPWDTNQTPDASQCGNGIKNSGEQCDDGNTNNEDSCRNDCKNNVCRDGHLNVGVEQCDDGNNNNNDQCNNQCRFNPFCGDGLTNQQTEQCDDGNVANDDGCKNDCTLNVCGDGLLNQGIEQCDDGNVENGDACNTDCTLPVGSCGDTNGTTIYDQNNNGESIDSETIGLCPDGQTVTNFSFSTDTHQWTWVCSDIGWDSEQCSATASYCGDEVVDDQESCDDGNDSDADDCKNDCSLNVCGDASLLEWVEECDDGNLENEDGCNESCKAEETTVKVVFDKVMCDDEQYLPNRGSEWASTVTDTTAQDYVAAHSDHCRLASDWSFQWAPQDVIAPADDFVGEADDWITTDATNTSGRTIIFVTLHNNPLYDGGDVSTIQVREVLQDGYIPFSKSIEHDPADYSAEIYCHTDGKNYDNLEWIQNLEIGTEYHCVAFNAPKPKVVKDNFHVTKYLCPYGTDLSNLSIDDAGNPNIDPLSLWCNVAAGYEFAYDTLDVSANGNPQYQPTNFASLWITDINGELHTYLDPSGVSDHKYLIWELLDGMWASDEQVLWLYCTTAPDNGVRSNNLEQIDYGKTNNIRCLAFNESPREPQYATIVATKVVCDKEVYLPDRGKRKKWAPDIDQYTAVNWINQDEEFQEHCWQEPNWYFQRAPDGTENPGDNLTTPAGDPWVTFGPTDQWWGAYAGINVDLYTGVRVREVLQEAYLPFVWKENTSKKTAEIYCSTDGKNFDNYDHIDLEADRIYYCVAFNTEYKEPKPKFATVVAQKIECDDESLLPNWWNGGPNINSTTAQAFLDQTDGRCTMVSGWNFQRAYNDTPNPWNQVQVADAPRTSFGPTDENGSVSTLVKVNKKKHYQIAVREVMNDGYLAFAGVDSEDNVSAEMYCYTDVLNYDNYDFIENPKVNETYYCIAFNVKQTTEDNESCGNGIKEWEEQCDGSDGVGENQHCSESCILLDDEVETAVCGNGSVETWEQCDDGNTGNNDWCSELCLIEAAEAVCGNESIEEGEQCDDGNTEDNDGCSASCQVEDSNPTEWWNESNGGEQNPTPPSVGGGWWGWGWWGGGFPGGWQLTPPSFSNQGGGWTPENPTNTAILPPELLVTGNDDEDKSPSDNDSGPGIANSPLPTLLETWALHNQNEQQSLFMLIYILISIATLWAWALMFRKD